jgi:anaerobic magnesium-protoporphyrin IX monomethyl ester cyclase
MSQTSLSILLISAGHDGSHAKHTSYRKVHRDPPPLGLLYIGTALKRAGYVVDLIDTHVDELWKLHLTDSLVSHNYLWAGLSCFVGQRQKNAAEITELVKYWRPDIPVVWGGPLPTVAGPELSKAYPKVDKMVAGEGEKWAVEYSDILAKIRTVRTVRDDTLCDWRIFGDAYNREQIPYYHMLMTSRGCPMQCTFCYKHTATNGYRLEPLEVVKATMLEMHKQTGTRVWTIGDDNFLGDPERAWQLLMWMRDKGFYFEEMIGHIGQLTEYVTEAMRGVVSTFIFSVETASPRLQRILKKGASIGTVAHKMGWLAKHRTAANCSFIFGLPTETQQERDMNAALMQQIREENDMVRGVSYVYFPLPGTPLVDWIRQELDISAVWPIKDYEQANFWPEKGDEGYKFRPWLSKAQYEEVAAQAVDFRERWAFPKPPPYKLDEVLGRT